MKSATILLGLLFSNALANAAALTENFDNRGNLAAATAVWNQALGKVHPSLQVVDYEAGFIPLRVDVGDGSDGAFDLSTYASFSVGGDLSGNKIHLDTDAHPVLQLNSFKLEAGWTLEPVGTRPLIIYSLTDIIIEGDIACQGLDGGNASNTIAGLGATGRCGGGSGGAGGAIGSAGFDGVSLLAPATAGQKGNFNSGAGTPGVSGGGGGAWNTTATASAGAPISGFGGAAGASFSDPEFANISVASAGGGGTGGGGGAATNIGGGKPGAGGGAGGGAVIIHAVRDFNLGSSTNAAIGSINVNGGIGGGTGHQGGAGGGGGGGSVKVFVGGTINIYNTSGVGASHANGGLGGTNTLTNNGGNGALGRSWFASNVYNGVGFYTPAEEAPVNAGAFLGGVQFNPASQSVTSKIFDLGGNFAQIQAIAVSPTSANFKFEVAGSSDNFVSSDTGFTENVNLISGKRYLKYRITLSGGDVNTPDMVDQASIQYVLGMREEFNLQAAGCGRVGTSAPPGNGLFFIFIVGFLGILKFKAQRRKTVRAKRIV